MPYIPPPNRAVLDTSIASIVNTLKKECNEETIEGSLNYTITSILNAMKLNSPTWRYKYINRVVGVLDCIKLEFYRRLAANYEDSAKETNGDLSIYDWI